LHLLLPTTTQLVAVVAVVVVVVDFGFLTKVCILLAVVAAAAAADQVTQQTLLVALEEIPNTFSPSDQLHSPVALAQFLVLVLAVLAYITAPVSLPGQAVMVAVGALLAQQGARKPIPVGIQKVQPVAAGVARLFLATQTLHG
jgi:hypothetical protein